MRIVLSVAVLIWHSYPAANGMQSAFQLWATPAGWFLQLILPAFFALSGFLVADSMCRNARLSTFLGLRVIRIFPALAVEVVISALVLGPTLTQFSLDQYFQDERFYSYFLNVLGVIHYELPGLFLSNPVPNIVNGNLWTVPFELECYILISILWIFGCFARKRFMLIAFILATAVVFGVNIYRGIDGSPPGAVNGRVLVLCFFAGVILFQFREVIRSDIRVFILSLIVAIFLTYGYYSVYFAPIFVAYATVYLGLATPERSAVIQSGDYSYGIYLYAAPVQQAVAYLFGGGSWLLNLALALPITFSIAYLSWHYVEKPTLKLKKLISKKRVLA